jgi:creatinine amidohydrolase/Fe(II)-dependent formamide hydrolase-like protein
MANPDSATAEKGAQIMDRIVEFTASFVERFREVDTKAIVADTPDHYGGRNP